MSVYGSLRSTNRSGKVKISSLAILTFIPKQKDTLLKIVINASNAVLGGLVIGSTLGKNFLPGIFVVGLGVYIVLVIVALSIER